MAACRFCLTCPEGYSLPRTPRKKFDPTIYYGPRATPEPGKPWWYLVFLGIQFPPIPTESVHHGTFLPQIAPESVCFRGLPIPHMHRNRYDRPPYCNGNGMPPAMNCPRPCHGNGTACNPLNSRNLLQPSDDKRLVGKRVALVSGESGGAKSVSY